MTLSVQRPQGGAAGEETVQNGGPLPPTDTCTCVSSLLSELHVELGVRLCLKKEFHCLTF